MQSVSVLLDITKFFDPEWKYADISRTYRVCHVIYILFQSALGKV